VVARLCSTCDNREVHNILVHGITRSTLGPTNRLQGAVVRNQLGRLRHGKIRLSFSDEEVGWGQVMVDLRLLTLRLLGPPAAAELRV
jgi:hypothetical protein